MSISESSYPSHRHPPGYHLRWAFLTFLAILATVAIISWIFYRPIAPYPYYSGWFPFGGFFILFWFIGIFWIVRWFFWGGRWGYCGYPRRYWRQYYYDNYDGAYQILRERYARGEITKEQYDQMMRDLQTTQQ